MKEYRELLIKLLREEWRAKDATHEEKMRLARKAYGYSFEEMCLSQRRERILSIIGLLRYLENVS